MDLDRDGDGFFHSSIICDVQISVVNSIFAKILGVSS